MPSTTTVHNSGRQKQGITDARHPLHIRKKKQTKQISAPDFLPCHGITIVMGRIVLIQSMEEEVGDPWRHLYQAPILTSRMAGNSISQGWTALFWIDVPLG